MPFGPKTLKTLDVDLSTLRQVPDAPGYYVSPEGRVFCIRELSQRVDGDGYRRVSICVGGRKRWPGIHSLLAKAFLPSPKPDQNEVRHLDDDRKNNSLDNLAFGTRAENAADMARNGTVKGENNANAILTSDQVVSIVGHINSRRKHRQIAAEFGVSRSTIKAIACGRLWGHLTSGLLVRRKKALGASS